MLSYHRFFFSLRKKKTNESYKSSSKVTTLDFLVVSFCSSTESSRGVIMDSFSFCNSLSVNPAKIVGDLGLLGDLDKLEALGDLGIEFRGDLPPDDLPDPERDLECPGIMH